MEEVGKITFLSNIVMLRIIFDIIRIFKTIIRNKRVILDLFFKKRMKQNINILFSVYFTKMLRAPEITLIDIVP